VNAKRVLDHLTSASAHQRPHGQRKPPQRPGRSEAGEAGHLIVLSGRTRRSCSSLSSSFANNSARRMSAAHSKDRASRCCRDAPISPPSSRSWCVTRSELVRLLEHGWRRAARRRSGSHRSTRPSSRGSGACAAMGECLQSCQRVRTAQISPRASRAVADLYLQARLSTSPGSSLQASRAGSRCRPPLRKDAVSWFEPATRRAGWRQLRDLPRIENGPPAGSDPGWAGEPVERADGIDTARCCRAARSGITISRIPSAAWKVDSWEQATSLPDRGVVRGSTGGWVPSWPSSEHRVVIRRGTEESLAAIRHTSQSRWQFEDPLECGRRKLAQATQAIGRSITSCGRLK